MSEGEASTSKMPGSAEQDRTLLSFLPKPVRIPIGWCVEIAGIVAALAMVLSWFGSFFSFVGRLVIWRDAWAHVVAWAGGLPALVQAIVHSLGAAAHYVIERYREIVHPIFAWVFQFLPFSLPPWAYDAFFLGSFAIFSWIRYARNVMHPEVSDGMEEILSDIRNYVSTSKLFAPIALLNAVGLVIVSPIWLLGATMYMRFHDVRDRIGLGLLYLSVTLGLTLPLLLLYLADWLYRSAR